jgi:hypothetical protein
MRWQTTLSAIRATKLELARIDPRAGMPLLPSAPASASAIAAAARKLGRPLPPSYAALLACHDGWPLFYQGANLLSARHLARGSYVELARLVTGELGQSSAETPALFPFGVDARGETIFAWDPSDVRADGELGIVVWMNEIGSVMDDFPSFLEFILDMLDSELAERRSVQGAFSPRKRLDVVPRLRWQAA